MANSSADQRLAALASSGDNYVAAAPPDVTPPPLPIQPDGAIRTLASGSYTDAVMTADGRSVLLESSNGTVSRIDLGTGATTGSWQVGDQLGGMDVTPDGRHLLATELTPGPKSSTNGDYHEAIYVHRLDLSTGEITTFEADVPVSGSTFFDIAATSDGKAIVSETGATALDTPLFTMDVASGAFTATRQTYRANTVLAPASDHSHVLLAPQSATGAPLYLYTSGQGITASHASGADGVTNHPTSVVAEGAEGRYSLQLADADLYLYDGQLKLATDLTALHPELAGGVAGAAFSPDASSLYLLDASADRVFQLSTATGALQASIPVGFNVNQSVDAGGNLTYSPYGDTLQVSSDRRYLGILAEGASTYIPQYQVIDLTKVVAETGLDQASVISASSYGVAYYGFGGDDTFVAANGAVLVGGAGDDSYVFAAGAAGPVVETADGGFDTIYAQVFTLPANVERLIGLPGGGDQLTGNADANVIIGNTDDDVISPGLGADLLTGGAGDDVFSGAMAELSGDTITDFAPGDEIHLSDAYLDTFSYSLVGGRLTYGPGYTLTLSGGIAGELAATDYTVNGKGYTIHYLKLAIADQPANVADFNGDGHGDILWRNTDGAVSEWQLHGSPNATQARVDTFDGFADTSWKIIDTFDFNGDGRSDILWRNANGAFSVWNATDGGFAGNSYTDSSVGNDWRIAAEGDLNGDGKDDLLWQRADGAISTWQSTGSAFVGNAYYNTSPGGTWKVVGLADFGGDGKPDILWRDADGAISTWAGTASGFTVNSYFDGSVNESWHIEGLGDFTGDGRADILWRNDNGAVSLWRANGSGFDQGAYNDASVDNSWHIAAVADFNDDRRADILWHNDNGSISTWEATASGSFVEAVYNNAAATSWSIVGHDYSFG